MVAVLWRRLWDLLSFRERPGMSGAVENMNNTGCSEGFHWAMVLRGQGTVGRCCRVRD